MVRKTCDRAPPRRRVPRRQSRHGQHCRQRDAPCSGTGTWRRQPEGRWRLSEKELARLTALQSRLLDVAAGLVAPQGRLIFVTCSVLDAEGADQIAAFLARHPGWRTETPVIGAGVARGGGLRLTPLHDDTDGFFVARLVPVC